MKLDQIAFYARTAPEAEEIKFGLGLLDADWVHDHVHGSLLVGPNLNPTVGLIQESRAHLQFNYDRGIEIEILTYLNGPHWHYNNDLFYRGSQPFISHLGYHLDDDEDFPAMTSPLVQIMETKSHTNPFLVAKGRRYLYRIHDTRQQIGAYTKFIKRIRGAKE